MKNFDFLFDYDADIPEDTEIYLPIEIDGTLYDTGGYYKNESGD